MKHVCVVMFVVEGVKPWLCVGPQEGGGTTVPRALSVCIYGVKVSEEMEQADRCV